MNGLPSSSGFEARREHFADTIDFYAPGLKRWQTSEWVPDSGRTFLPVSVTGTACALQCEHCKSNVLKGMLSVPAAGDLFRLAQRLQAGGTRGILVSDGSTRRGNVPLLPHLDDMRRIREQLGMSVVVHSGVVTEAVAAGLADVGVDAVMLDIMGADETIRDVYHLDLSVDDFERSIALLADRNLRIIPHIVLGMHFGQMRGEPRALEMIARYPVSTLILVVLMPLTGTPMAGIAPPPLAEIEAFFETARLAMPDTPINLGCGRPMGELKVQLDRAAIDHGLNGIAYPAEGAIAYAASKGLEPRLYETCCSVTWLGGAGAGYEQIALDEAGAPTLAEAP